jgi:hypothetical protein
LLVFFNTLYKNEKLEQKEIYISKPPALKRSLTAPSDTDQAKVIQQLAHKLEDMQRKIKQQEKSFK